MFGSLATPRHPVARMAQERLDRDPPREGQGGSGFARRGSNREGPNRKASKPSVFGPDGPKVLRLEIWAT